MKARFDFKRTVTFVFSSRGVFHVDTSSNRAYFSCKTYRSAQVWKKGWLCYLWDIGTHPKPTNRKHISVFTCTVWNLGFFFWDVGSHRVSIVLCLLVSVSPFFSSDFLVVFLSLAPLPHTLSPSLPLFLHQLSSSLPPPVQLPLFFLLLHNPIWSISPNSGTASSGTYRQWELLFVCAVFKISMRTNMIGSALLVEAANRHLGSGIPGWCNQERGVHRPGGTHRQWRTC